MPESIKNLLDDKPSTWVGMTIRHRESGRMASVTGSDRFQVDLDGVERVHYSKIRKEWEAV
jgi:hypothetical protein